MGLRVIDDLGRVHFANRNAFKDGVHDGKFGIGENTYVEHSTSWREYNRGYELGCTAPALGGQND